jgi:ribulose-5-phosphate 4-epimerase/fuculose-1-phosphate aldolase
MILRNHGFVACGQTVEDALHLTFHTIIACETQVKTQSKHDHIPG